MIVFNVAEREKGGNICLPSDATGIYLLFYQLFTEVMEGVQWKANFQREPVPSI